jgi:hypothetical protein
MAVDDRHPLLGHVGMQAEVDLHFAGHLPRPLQPLAVAIQHKYLLRAEVPVMPASRVARGHANPLPDARADVPSRGIS